MSVILRGVRFVTQARNKSRIREGTSTLCSKLHFMKNIFYSGILLSLIFLLIGCSTDLSVQHKPVSYSPGQALLTVYLTSSGVAEVVREIQIEEVAFEVDGAWIPLGFHGRSANFTQLKDRQLLLGVSSAPLGEHRRLRLRVRGDNGDEVHDYTLLLGKSLLLEKGQSKCLFVNWQMRAEKPGSAILQPFFTANGQNDVLASDLLYVSCGEIGTVYLVRLDNNQVVASFAVPGPLGAIRLQADQRRLYILSRGQRAIFVYDCLNARLVDRFNLSTAIDPDEMELSADGHFAFVSDSGAGAVFKINLANGDLLAQYRFGARAGRLAVNSSAGLLAVSLPASNQVYLLDMQTLRAVRVIPVGSKPAGLMFFANSLYVAEKGDATVGVFAPQSGQQRSKLAVGLAPDSFLLIDQDTAYVSQVKGGGLSVLSAGQNVAFRQIGALSSPTVMDLAQRRGRFYVASQQENKVSVVDLESEKVEVGLVVGGIVNSLAVFE